VTPRVSVIVTAHNEGEQIVPYLDRLLEAVTLPCEVLVVYDSADDTTAPPLARYAQSGPCHQVRRRSRTGRSHRRDHG
jgi:dolichol-phosphate mannosyltransferase